LWRKRACSKRQKRKEYQWLKTTMVQTDTTWKGTEPPNTDIDFPINLFRKFCNWINEYQLIGANQLERFLKKMRATEGLLLRNARISRPFSCSWVLWSFSHCWCTGEKTIRYSPVADGVSEDRFMQLLTNFHICDDMLAITSRHPEHDKLFKTRPSHDDFRQNLTLVP
jgi:hypothetical protein